MGNSRIHCYENKEIMTDVRKGYENIKFSYEAVASFKPLNPRIKIWILICCPYSFATEALGRNW